MQLNIPKQGVIDRQEYKYGQFLQSHEVRDHGVLIQILFTPFTSISGEHDPGDPSVFQRPTTRGWYCPAPYNTAACVWLGGIL